ncbi:MAG: transposase [Lewinella sp.]
MGQPHFQHIGATFSITISVHDAVPMQLLERVIKRRKIVLAEIDRNGLPDKSLRKEIIHDKFYRYLDKLLHTRRNQEHPLAEPNAVQKVVDRIWQLSEQYYEVIAYSIMSNHVHLQLDFSKQCPDDWDGYSVIPEYRNLAQVIGFIKGGSAFDVNKSTGRKGKLWSKGYYDRYIRDQRHFMNEFYYILGNPEKAGLVDNWRDHSFTYGTPDLLR